MLGLYDGIDTAGIDYASPVIYDHPLNVGKVFWGLCLPGFMGGAKLRDLMSPPDLAVGNHGTLTGMGDPNLPSGANGWRGTNRPGGLGSLLFDGSAGRVILNTLPNLSTSSAGRGLIAVGFWVYPTGTASTRYRIFDNNIGGGNVIEIGDAGGIVSGTGTVGLNNNPVSNNGVVTWNAWNRIVVVYPNASASGSNSAVFYVNGQSVGIQTTANTFIGGTLTSGGIGWRSNITEFYRGYLDSFVIWDLTKRTFSAKDAANDYDLEQRGYPGMLRRIGTTVYFGVAGGGTVYSLPAAAGAFALTGQAAGLSIQRRLPAAAGSFTLAGQSASLSIQRRLAAGAGAFALTGDPATLSVGRRLTTGAGTFTLAGAAASLSVQRRLPAAAGSFALTGQSATLSVGRVLSAGAGAFTLTGQPAGLSIQRRLTAGTGVFTLTGMAATLTASGVAVATGRPLALQWSVATSVAVSWAAGTIIDLPWSVGAVIQVTWSGAMAVITNFAFYPGEDILLQCGRLASDTTVITGETLRFQMWLGIIPTGAPVVDSNVAVDIVFVITDAANFTVALPKADTVNLARGVYWYQITRTTAGKDAVLAAGQITLLPYLGHG
jgi:hypothetical protein